MEINKLQQLIAFSECKTLSAAAESLNISQPALSRSMQLLEEELEIDIFERKKNSLVLNDNGRFLVEKAKPLVEAISELKQTLLAHNLSKKTLNMGLCTPSPIWRLSPLFTTFFPDTPLKIDIADDKNLSIGLLNGKYDLIVTCLKPLATDIFYKDLCDDELLIALPSTHRLAKNKQVKLGDVNGEEIIMMPKYGIWEKIVLEHLPNSSVVFAPNRAVLENIIADSNDPFFVTTMAIQYFGFHFQRNLLPISDNESKLKYYIVCRNERKRDFSPILDSI